MPYVLDAGGLYTFLDTDDAEHEAVGAAIADDPGPFILSPFVLPELGHLVQRRLGAAAALALLDDVNDGVYTLVTFGAEDLHAANALVRRHQALGIGLTDASVAVIASKYRTVNLLCRDERHFRAIRPLRGGAAFRLLPYDMQH